MELTVSRGLQAGLSQHFLGLFQREFRVIPHDNRQQLGSHLREAELLRRPGVSLSSRSGFMAGRLGQRGGGCQAIEPAWLIQRPRRPPMRKKEPSPTGSARPGVLVCGVKN